MKNLTLRKVKNTSMAALFTVFLPNYLAIADVSPVVSFESFAKSVSADSIDAQAEAAPLTLNWNYYKNNDQALMNAANAQPGWKMLPANEGYFRLYSSFWVFTYSPAFYNWADVGSLSPIIGYPVKPNAFSNAQLASVGVTRTTRYRSGYLKTTVSVGDDLRAYNQLRQDKTNPSQDIVFSGWPLEHYSSIQEGDAAYLRVYYHYIYIPYNSLSHSPEVVAKRLKALL